MILSCLFHFAFLTFPIFHINNYFLCNDCEWECQNLLLYIFLFFYRSFYVKYLVKIQYTGTKSDKKMTLFFFSLIGNSFPLLSVIPNLSQTQLSMSKGNSRQYFLFTRIYPTQTQFRRNVCFSVVMEMIMLDQSRSKSWIVKPHLSTVWLWCIHIACRSFLSPHASNTPLRLQTINDQLDIKCLGFL